MTTWAVVFRLDGIDDIPLVYTFDSGTEAEAWLNEGIIRRPGSSGVVIRLRKAPPWPKNVVIPFDHRIANS